MPTKQWAIDQGLELPPNTLRTTDVLIRVDLDSHVLGGPLRGGKSADTHIARRLHALHDFVGLTLDETIQGMKDRPDVPWGMKDYYCHVARGRCIVARDGKLLDHTGKVTKVDARR
jgi:hypothetical protein